ncbi:MAG: cytochrome c3 family protein [Deltaproteobacteria bacterium]
MHSADAWLNYPNVTVGHADTVPGRNWRLPYPQDIRNCQACHNATTTSGSWQTHPTRLACGGCHDSDAANAHLAAQIYDPTPALPYSGDEVETCNVCH